MFRFTVQEKDFLPGMNVPDVRPRSTITPRKDWGNEDSGAVLVHVGARHQMIVTVEEVIRHLARRGAVVRERHWWRKS